MSKLFSYDIEAFRVLGNTGADIPPGRALSIVTPPTDPPTVGVCAAGAWPWAVSWYNPDAVPANISPTRDGYAVSFDEPNIYVAVDGALSKDTYLKVTTDGQFGAANGAIPCCQLLETTTGAGLAWATTVIGRLRNVGIATITTSDPGPYTSLSTIAELSVDVIIRTGAAIVVGFCDFDQQSGDDFRISLYIDDNLAGVTRRFKKGGVLLSDIDAKQFQFLPAGLSAGAHTFAIKVEATAGAARPSGTDRALQVIEI